MKTKISPYGREIVNRLRRAGCKEAAKLLIRAEKEGLANKVYYSLAGAFVWTDLGIDESIVLECAADTLDELGWEGGFSMVKTLLHIGDKK